jgi:hypothetical protein
MPYVFGGKYGQKTALNYMSAKELLDQITGASVAYSIRKLKSSATKAVRVRRSLDNGEIDIAFNGLNLDTATLLSHCGTYSGYVTTWYDQSGNGNNALQPTAGNQPRIVNAGTIDVDVYGKASVVFNGSSTVLKIANSASVDITSAPLLLNAVLSPFTGSSGYILSKNLDSVVTVQYAMLAPDGKVQMLLGGTGSVVQETAFPSLVSNTVNIYSGVFTDGNQKGYANGVNSGSDGTYSGVLTSRANMQIGCRSTSAGGTSWSSFISASISELIVSVAPSSRVSIEKSQGAYYGVTVP